MKETRVEIAVTMKLGFAVTGDDASESEIKYALERPQNQEEIMRHISEAVKYGQRPLAYIDPVEGREIHLTEFLFADVDEVEIMP